jgi:hypothetical protein
VPKPDHSGDVVLDVSFGETCLLEQVVQQTYFQWPVAMYGHRQPDGRTRASIDVMAAIYSLKLLAMPLERTGKLFTRYGFQTAISSTRS